MDTNGLVVFALATDDIWDSKARELIQQMAVRVNRLEVQAKQGCDELEL
jgi:hypothetical protein